MSKRKILFFIESLGGGGAEKVLSTIVRHIDTQRFEVTVCVVTAGGKYDEEVASHVRIHSLLKSPKEYHGIGRLWYWIKYHLIYHWLPAWIVYKLFIPKGNDVEVAFVEGFVTKLMASSTNKQSKKIAWVHCDLKNQPWPIALGIYSGMEEERSAYEKYDVVVCVSKLVENVMKQHYGLSNTKTIYNPIDEERVLSLAKETSEWYIDTSKFNLISVGRLEKVKGYDELIAVIKDVRNEGVDAHLWLVGEGTEEEKLKNFAKQAGVEKHITFTGFLINPYSLMSKMNLFVCSSRAEGFSLVIAEAMLLGLPVISMNCAGPRELIGDNRNGILCDSYEELGAEIIRKAKESDNRFPQSLPFNTETVMFQIENLLEENSNG